MKYGNRKTEVDGVTFDSKKEANRYFELKLLQVSGDIAELELQPSFVLTGADGNPLRYDSKRAVRYVADFRYYDLRKGHEGWIIEDTKGMKTPAYKLKRAIMRSMGFEIVET